MKWKTQCQLYFQFNIPEKSTLNTCGWTQTEYLFELNCTITFHFQQPWYGSQPDSYIWHCSTLQFSARHIPHALTHEKWVELKHLYPRLQLALSSWSIENLTIPLYLTTNEFKGQIQSHSFTTVIYTSETSRVRTYIDKWSLIWSHVEKDQFCHIIYDIGWLGGSNTSFIIFWPLSQPSQRCDCQRKYFFYTYLLVPKIYIIHIQNTSLIAP